MNMDRFTKKALEALQSAQSLAVERGNQQMEQVHLLLALVSDEQGLVSQLLAAMDMTVPSLRAAVQAEVDKLPRVSGAGREADRMYISRERDDALSAAFDNALHAAPETRRAHVTPIRKSRQMSAEKEFVCARASTSRSRSAAKH